MKKDAVAPEALADHTAAAICGLCASLSTQLGRLAGEGRSVSAWRVLGLLADGGPQRVGDLAVRQHIAQPSMTALVRRMVHEGLAAKASDPADHRAALVELTGHGRNQVREYRRRAASILDLALNQLDPGEQQLLASCVPVLERVAETLQACATDEQMRSNQ